MLQNIVILSHQGGSFIDKLSKAIHHLGMDCSIISSLPESDADQEAYMNRPNSYLINKLELCFDDVNEVVENKIGVNGLSGFISVWEGYRPLMSALNCHYNFNDISEEVAFCLRDKLSTRRKLNDYGLSLVYSKLVKPEELISEIESNKRLFIKPRFGLGSIGAKELIDSTDIDYIKQLQMKLKDDKLLSGAVCDAEFILEDFISGKELSAEIFVDDGRVEILAYHEKTELSHGIYTTTEPFCVSPPQTVFDRGKASIWLNKVLSSLSATFGCYHVEFKVVTESEFELIEINPRIGGTLIIESTQHVSGVNMLSRWVSSISKFNENNDQDSYLKVTKKNLNDVADLRYSAFRVYFSNIKGVIENISHKNCDPYPKILDILVKPGQELLREESEQYLAQALWVGSAESSDEVERCQQKIQSMSRDILSFEVRPNSNYENVFLIIDYNLNRVDEVIMMAKKCYAAYGIKTVLATEPGKEIEHPLIHNVISEKIRELSFARNCVRSLALNQFHCKGGVVFSDDAIVMGSKILWHLGLRTDCPEHAIASFDKLLYRKYEEEQMLPVGVSRPKFTTPEAISDDDFYQCPTWVFKPRCEGNNRGVVIITSPDEVRSSIIANAEYSDAGFILEECVKKKAEFSVDGVNSQQFITEKISLEGAFPLEIGQVQPAWQDEDIMNIIISASQFANQISGHLHGAFHNEIMISDDTGEAFVIEPNRRPGGMKIWNLIWYCYGINLYDKWLQSSFGHQNLFDSQFNLEPIKSAGTLMLPGPGGWSLNQNIITKNLEQLIDRTWQSIGIYKHRPMFHDVEFIAPDDYIFPENCIDGHSFMISLCFTSPLDENFSELLYSFYEHWNTIIHDQSIFVGDTTDMNELMNLRN